MARTNSDKSLEDLIAQVNDLALVDLAQFVETITPSQGQELTRHFDNQITWLTRASAYIDARTRGYNDTHKDAVKQSNSEATKVRKALGYSIPKQDINF